MEYLKINGNDYSAFVSGIKVATSAHYNAQTNTAGDTVIDYINSKRVISVSFIPMSDSNMIRVLADLGAFSVAVSFRNPRTNTIEENINCIAAKETIEYYTIQQNNVSYKAFTIDFTEL